MEAATRLSEISTFLSGGTPRKGDDRYWSNGHIPWLTPKDMGRWDGDTDTHVTQLAIGNGTRLAPDKSVFLAVRGMSLHNEIRLLRADREMSFNQDIKAIVPKPGVSQAYLFYALQAQKSVLLGSVEASGHGTGTLPTRHIENLLIPRFGGNGEATLGELFAALDDKIELNRRMNETLEANARALFRDWFVDFGPTRAKAEGRPAYLDPSTWSLFPDDFNDVGSPKGWGYLPLQDITTELRRGISPKYVQYDGVKVLNQKCIRGRSVNFDLARRHDVAAKSVSGRFLEFGDILINSTGVGTLGRTGQVWTLDEATIVDSHVTVVRADPTQISSVILGIDLNGRESEIEALGQGSTGQTELSRTQLGQLLVLVADKNIQERFDFAVKPSLEAISNNVTEYRALAETRDTLLPKLMSGTIRVRDAESAVAALC